MPEWNLKMQNYEVRPNILTFHTQEIRVNFKNNFSI